jgi:hypothetical protein
MIHALGKDRTDVLIRKGIINGLAVPSEADELGLLQNAELMRDRGNRHAEKLRDIANAHFAFEKQIKDLDPGAVAENLEKLGKIIKQFLIGHLLRHFFDYILMRLHGFTMRYGIAHNFASFVQIII